MSIKKILMVLTSHEFLGNTGEKTGFWIEEFAAPYYLFKDAGVEITLVSPAGGQPPIDSIPMLLQNALSGVSSDSSPRRNMS